ncbi:Long-chain base-1-phosphate phosphatase [Coemansia sp. BCRC 34301]|nr:Long-chain base-1-phosphate phosphatase [Coemansia sp. BCRC 34301]
MVPRFQLDEDIDAAVESTPFVKAPETAYEAVYSPTRQLLRRIIVDEVEREIPRLVAIQQKYRTPALDRFFIFTGMLGNHTFFLLALPFLHVFGLGRFARGLTFVVLWSVYLSGVAKDYISAPRPVSPPVAQITQSPAHTLEYGFPSSHTAYVVASIAYVSYHMIGEWGTSLVWPCVLWAVGLAVIIGRVYCGLHSFVDVAGGAAIGTAEAVFFIMLYDSIDALLLSAAGPLYIMVFVYLALLAIPPSLDLCPCCIDSVCATSVTLGVAVGTWIHARLPFLWHNGHHDRIAWDSSLTFGQNVLRCLIIIVLIVMWKLASKPAMTRLARSLVLGSASRKSYSIPTTESIMAGKYGTYEIMASPENIARVPIYAGIGVIACAASPIVFHMLDLCPT